MTQVAIARGCVGERHHQAVRVPLVQPFRARVRPPRATQEPRQLPAQRVERFTKRPPAMLLLRSEMHQHDMIDLLHWPTPLMEFRIPKSEIRNKSEFQRGNQGIRYARLEIGI